MLKTLAFGTAVLLSTLSFAADAKQDVSSAAAKLSDAANYSWKSTTENADGGNGAIVEGKTEKDGYTLLHITFGDNTMDLAIKGGKGALKTDDEWKTLDEAAKGDDDQANRAKFFSRMVPQFKTPGPEAKQIASETKELKEAGDAISGELTEAGVKNLLLFYRPRTGESAPQVTNPKGSAKFWLTDGALTKFQYHVSGTVTMNCNDRDVDRTTTTEISNVGSTKMDVPAEVKAKLP